MSWTAGGNATTVAEAEVYLRESFVRDVREVGDEERELAQFEDAVTAVNALVTHLDPAKPIKARAHGHSAPDGGDMRGTYTAIHVAEHVGTDATADVPPTPSQRA